MTSKIVLNLKLNNLQIYCFKLGVLFCGKDESETYILAPNRGRVQNLSSIEIKDGDKSENDNEKGE